MSLALTLLFFLYIRNPGSPPCVPALGGVRKESTIYMIGTCTQDCMNPFFLDSEDFCVVSTSRHAQLRNTFMFSTFISLVTTIFFVEVIRRLRRTITWKFSVRVKGKTCHLVVEDYLHPTELKAGVRGKSISTSAWVFSAVYKDGIWGYVPEPYNENWITRKMKSFAKIC